MDNNEQREGYKNPNTENKGLCNETNKEFCMDESYRIDDNPNYSPTAQAENKNIDDPLIPGVGTEEENI